MVHGGYECLVGLCDLWCHSFVCNALSASSDCYVASSILLDVLQDIATLLQTHEIRQEFEDLGCVCVPNKGDGRNLLMMMLLTFLCFFSA